MGPKLLPISLFIVVTYISLVNARVTVISSLCQAEDENGQSRWMSCPAESRGPSKNVREMVDNLKSGDDEQKFCCGSASERFCCSFQEKVKEVPDFDPQTHMDDSVRYRYHGPLHFWHYLFIFGLTILVLGLIGYLFGCIAFELIYCICCCCGAFDKKKKAKNAAKKGQKQPNAWRSPSGESSSLIVNNSGVPVTRPPQSYETIRPANFGGTADLYQNMTPPPSYNSSVQPLTHV